MNKMFGEFTTHALIVGVGGRGLNAIQRLRDSQLVTEIYVGVSHNQDQLDLAKCKIKYKVHFEEKDKFLELEKMLESNSLLNKSVVIVINGLGGVSEQYLPELLMKIKRTDNLILSIVSLPFSFEANERHEKAKIHLELVDQMSDMMVVLPNDGILNRADKNTSLVDALKMQDKVVENIVDAINTADKKVFSSEIGNYKNYIHQFIIDIVPKDLGYVCMRNNNTIR